MAMTPPAESSAAVNQFGAPQDWLGELNAETASALVMAAADVALILDDKGVIRDLAFGSEDLAAQWAGQWLGRPWIEIVTIESRSKVEALLNQAEAGPAPRWRHINHPSPHGADVPVLYSAVPLGREGRLIVIGRDLRATAALQQRLVDAQQSLERDYSRLRHVEMRYRLLFQMMSEAVLVVDAASRKVVEANPAAGLLLGEALPRIIGQPVAASFDVPGTEAVQALLAGVRATGRESETRARLASDARELVVAASLFRQANTPLFLVRLLPAEAASAQGAEPAKQELVEVVQAAPDGVILTGPDGRISSANAAFLDLAQLATEAQARGESLDRWLGRPGVDLNVLIANLRQHGSVRLFATTLRGEYGAVAEIEVSAVSVWQDGRPHFGFIIRNVGRRLVADRRATRELPRSVEQLTELVGRVPLKDLVRETTDVIERLCIEAALELTGDNRASAAEILGLSRQSLYVKLRRYGLGDLGPESED